MAANFFRHGIFSRQGWDSREFLCARLISNAVPTTQGAENRQKTGWVYFIIGQFMEQLSSQPYRLTMREGSAKAQGVIGMVTGAGPGSMPQGGGWHFDAGPGRSEDISYPF